MCMVIYEVFGRNLDVVKAALTVTDPSLNHRPLIASAYSWAGITSTDMSIFLNKCLKYETEIDPQLKHIYLWGV